MKQAQSSPSRWRRGAGLWPVLVVPLVGILCFMAGAAFNELSRPPAPPVQPLDGPALRVMSFNIRVENAGDGDNNWPFRRDMVASTIRFHQADIVGLQETYHGMAEDLQQRLGAYRWVGEGSSGNGEGAANPVFWRESRLEKISHQAIWLSETPDEVSVGWDASTTRVVTYVVLRERHSGAELHVFNTHFDHRGQEAKLESAKLLAARVSALPADTRVILMGDFNCIPGSEPLEEILAGTNLDDSYGLSFTGHHGPTGSFKGFRSNRYSGRRIDHIFVQNLAVQQHAILPDHFDERQPSDHFPVVAEIVIE